MKFEIDKGEKKGSGQKRYRFEVSLTGAVGLGTVLVLGVVWVFIFGVLVGRGYQPEDQLPELAKIMPEAHQESAQSGVIKPEDLRFHDALRDEGKAGSAQAQAEKDAAPVASGSTVQEKNIAKADSTPVAAEEPAVAAAAPEAEAAASQPAVNAAPEVKSAAKAEAPVQAPQKVAEATKPVQSRIDARGPVATSGSEEKASESFGVDDENQDQTVYNYIYQVASLSKPEAALRFRDKVRSLGLKSEVKVVKGEKQYWHRVVVLFQGRPIDTREMKAKLKSLGVDKPLLRSKAPLAGQASVQPAKVLSRR